MQIERPHAGVKGGAFLFPRYLDIVPVSGRMMGQVSIASAFAAIFRGAVNSRAWYNAWKFNSFLENKLQYDGLLKESSHRSSRQQLTSVDG